MAEPKPIKVFYSWQSEAYPKVCRNLIEDCLKKAIKERNRELTLVEPDREEQGESGRLVMDKDTRGVPGSPDIVESILRKIRDADIFVGDLTVVRPGEHPARPASNANVLVETGYALGVLGRDKVILAFNTHFGVIPNDLPFNLRQTSICGYEADPESKDLAASRKVLTGVLKEKLESIIQILEPGVTEPPDPKVQVIKAIQEQSRNRKKLFEAYLMGALEDAVKFAVTGRQEPPDPEPFVKSVDQALEVIRPVFEIIDAIAENDDVGALNVVNKGILFLLKVIWEGGDYDRRTDLPKFLGYLIYCYVAAACIREENFATLAGFLEEQHSIRLRSGEPHTVTYGEFSRSIRSLDHLDSQGYYSPVGALVSRLCDEKKVSLTPEAYVEADSILWLKSALGKEGLWSPGACQLLLKYPPTILLRARSRKLAERLAPLLGLQTLDEAGSRVQEAFARLYSQLGQRQGEVVGMYIHGNKPDKFASL